MRIDFETTLNAEKQTRNQYWNELTQKYFVGMTVHAQPNLKASWTACTMGDVKVLIASSERAVVQRWLSQPPTVATGRVHVHLQNHGVSVTNQHGRSAAISSGDLTFCEADEPYELLISDKNEAIVIDCPRDRFEGVLVPYAIVRPRSLPPVSLLHNFVRSVFQQNWQDDDSAGGSEEYLADAVVSMLKACMSESPPQSADLSNDGATILKFVDQYIDDSSLRTSLIAERLSITPQAVQKVFANLGTTPTAYMLNRRLTLAAARLGDGRFDGTMTDLALELGFSDAAHFSRRFKTRFSMSPSQYALQAKLRCQ